MTNGLMGHHYTEFLNTTVPAATSIRQCPNLPYSWCHVQRNGILQICEGHFKAMDFVCWPVERPWWYDLLMERPAWWAGAMCGCVIFLVAVLTAYLWYVGLPSTPMLEQEYPGEKKKEKKKVKKR